MTRAQWTVACAAVMVLTLARIASTHRVFSQTFDEAVHIAAGYERLTTGEILDPEHPPLARVLFALPFRNVPRPDARPWDWHRIGNALLGHDGQYVRNLAQARLGNLAFVLLGMIGVVAWAAHLLGRSAALWALIFFASLPPILAHGGLATTDMAGAAALPLAALALTLVVERPTWLNALFLGGALGIGLLTKMSFVPFFGLSAIVICALRRRFPATRLLAACAVSLLMVWAAYSFKMGTMYDVDPTAAAASERILGSAVFSDVPLPAPKYWAGLLFVRQHDLNGHEAYLLGKVSTAGWWYYFPVALAVKTPIPLLVLAASGMVLAIKRRVHLELVLIPVAILAFSMLGSINIGVRHILPVYAPLSILAGWAATEWWSATGIKRAAAAILAAWSIAGPAMAHPDYLPWMNAIAGREPSRVLVDSNYDWGQDLLRLARVCRARGISRLGTSIFTMADTDVIGLPERFEIAWQEPATGWIAISATQLRIAQAKDPNAYGWLLQSGRYERIGKTIRLYRVMPD